MIPNIDLYRYTQKEAVNGSWCRATILVFAEGEFATTRSFHASIWLQNVKGSGLCQDCSLSRELRNSLSVVVADMDNDRDQDVLDSLPERHGLKTN